MDFYSKAIKEFGQSFGTGIVPTSIGQNYVTVVGPDRKKIMKRNSYIVVAQSRDYQTVNPSTTIAAALLNGGQCEFRIESGIADVIDYCMIKLQVSNATGGAVVLAPAPLRINSIQVWAQNGSNLLNTVYGHELYLGNTFLPRNEYENFCDGLGLTTACLLLDSHMCNLIEPGCLGLQPKVGCEFLLNLNICKIPIDEKYREGLMKRTLKRELKST